jgi:hypothetical protein
MMPLILWCAFFSVLVALQGAALVAMILNTFPAPIPLANLVLPEWQYLLRPEWETVIFRFSVALAIPLMGLFLWRWWGRAKDQEFMSRLKFFISAETVLVGLLLSVLFKIAVYDDSPDCVRLTLTIVLILLLISKCIGLRFQSLVSAVQSFLNREEHQPYLKWWFNTGIIVFIGALLYMPHPEAVVARMFVGEQFHHNDSFIMGPGLAYTTGAIPDVDVISQYGIGFVVIISQLSKILGGFNYVNVLVVMVGFTIVYYWAWHWLLRRWLGSTVIAATVLLLGIKWQMFHWSAYPLVFTYGSQTPMRFIYDAVFFILFWFYLEKKHAAFLFAAAITAGFGIYYFTSEGMYGTAALYAFILISALVPSLKQAYRLSLLDRLICLVLPPLTFFVLIFLTVGNHALTPGFWKNMGEFIEYFMSGFGLESMVKTLAARNFLQSLMGFIIPIAYVLTVLVTGTRIFLGRFTARDVFTLILCLYGLGTFHYYVARSVVTSYYTVGLPFAFILGFWLKLVLEEASLRRARAISMALFITVLGALLTTHMVVSYPNVLSLRGNPLTDPKVALPLEGGRPYFHHLFRDYPDALKLPVNSLGQANDGIVSEQDFDSDAALVEYYRKAADFSQDAGLIGKLVSGDEPVPLISSFEIPILMQAHRRPYFYYFPLVISRPMTMRMFTATSIYTTDQMQKVLNQLETDQPPYIFMEKIFLTSQVPKEYGFQYPTLLILLNYVRTHYQPHQQGQYLVAMKRIEK